MKPIFRVCALAFAMMAGACAEPFVIHTPRDFSRIQEPPSQWRYRAVSAYGVALTVRIENNEGQAGLEFWTEAVDRTLRKAPAYQPAGMVEVKSPNGVAGKRLEYTYGNPENLSVYVVTLFVTPSKVYILETGGTREAFARAKTGVDEALRTFTPAM